MTARYDACILAGGLARRLGGRDKPGMRVSGRPLVESVAAAVAGADRLVIVGPPRDGLPHAVFRREDPPGGGPVPALRAGMAEVTAPWVALLAADLPFLEAGHVTALLEAATGQEREQDREREREQDREQDRERDREQDREREREQGRGPAAGAVLADDDGREQWLAGVWRTDNLKTALADYEGRSLHGLLAPLSPAVLRLTGRPWFDCDTMDDLRRAREAGPGPGGEDATASPAPGTRLPGAGVTGVTDDKE